jgi:hypothetical protein
VKEQELQVSWYRIEAKLPQHKKYAPLSDAAFRLAITAGAWCAEYYTDGIVPKKVVGSLTKAPSGKKLQKAIDELLENGIWVSKSSEYEIHDFLDWNMSREQWEAKKENGSRGGKAKSLNNNGLDTDEDLAGAVAPATAGATAGATAKQDISLEQKPSKCSSEIVATPLADSDSEFYREEREKKDSFSIKSTLQPCHTRFGSSMRGHGPGRRPDVISLHKAWSVAVARPGAVLRAADGDDAYMLAGAIEAHGMNDCLLVAKYATKDGMVNGTKDDKGSKHESIRYIFGNEETFSRILAMASLEESRKSGTNVATILKNNLSAGRLLDD